MHSWSVNPKPGYRRAIPKCIACQLNAMPLKLNVVSLKLINLEPSLCNVFVTLQDIPVTQNYSNSTTDVLPDTTSPNDMQNITHNYQTAKFWIRLRYHHYDSNTTCIYYQKAENYMKLFLLANIMLGIPGRALSNSLVDSANACLR